MFMFGSYRFVECYIGRDWVFASFDALDYKVETPTLCTMIF